MSVIDDLTVEEFKEFFSRNFPYLPAYQEGKTYFTGDVVYESPNFYQSLIDENLSPLSNESAWKIIKDSMENYVTDKDIEKAWQEATVSFNLDLCGCDENAKIIFFYLVAFYLAYDLQLAAGGAYGQVVFPATSVSVGSVAESYYVPQAYLENPILSFYARNGFGLKYLNMVYPKLLGNVRAVGGWSLP